MAAAVRSTGFAVEASVDPASGSTRSPAAAHASTHASPGPPALVRTATRPPRGSGWRASRPATSNISPTVSARSTPACANSASTFTSAAASSAPSCDDAARRAPAVRALLTATIGFAVVIRRAMRPNRRGFPNDSRWSANTAVPGSCSQYSRKSLPERSALSPIETNEENPIPRAAAASIAAIPNPPLWAAKPMLPGGGVVGASVASRAISGPGLATPRESGPTSRIPAERQTATSSSTSATPGVSTTRARTPAAAHACAAVTTASAGTAITASSASVISSPASRTWTGPSKPAASSVRATPPPPITATDDGRSTCATAATSAVRWRSSKCRRASRDSDVGNSSSISPSDRRETTGKPESWNTPSIGRFSDRTLAVKVSIRSSAAACARWASSTVAIPWPCQASATAKATSARPGDARMYVPCPMTEPSAPRSASRDNPSPGSAARRAAPSRSTPALKKRNQRERSDSEARKLRSRGTSSPAAGRTCTVEPSRSTMSVSITGAIAPRSSQPDDSGGNY